MGILDYIMDKLILLPALAIAISFHECAHAYSSYKLGDPTPMQQGRVTLNPIKHIDIIGLICLFFAGFGWGKAVQIDPRYYKHPRRDQLIVSLAGVVTNFITAFLFVIVIKLLYTFAGSFLLTEVGGIIDMMLYYIVNINIVLMVFNLLPIPPLDGFQAIVEIFNFPKRDLYYKIYQAGPFILLLCVFTGVAGKVINPIIFAIMKFMFSVVGLI